jgi:hypothetical protein
MTFTYDLGLTTLGKMRFLLGDITLAGANFQDEELNMVLNLTIAQMSGPIGAPNQVGYYGPSLMQNEVLFMACGTALDSLAARVASGTAGQTISIGDYKLTGKDQVTQIKALADGFRTAINEMPAWGYIEDNSSGFNELTIIRNWVLRTEL